MGQSWSTKPEKLLTIGGGQPQRLPIKELLLTLDCGL